MKGIGIPLETYLEASYPYHALLAYLAQVQQEACEIEIRHINKNDDDGCIPRFSCLRPQRVGVLQH